jgi:hypothetical protein
MPRLPTFVVRCRLMRTAHSEHPALSSGSASQDQPLNQGPNPGPNTPLSPALSPRKRRERGDLPGDAL